MLKAAFKLGSIAALVLIVITVLSSYVYLNRYVFNAPNSTTTQTELSFTNCGNLRFQDGSLRVFSNNSTAVENCFLNAYANDAPASMNLTFMGVDSGSTYQLVIGGVPGSIYVTQTNYVVPRYSNTTTYYCDGLEQNYRVAYSNSSPGVLITCPNNHNIFIPNATSQSVPLS